MLFFLCVFWAISTDAQSLLLDLCLGITLSGLEGVIVGIEIKARIFFQQDRASTLCVLFSPEELHFYEVSNRMPLIFHLLVRMPSGCYISRYNVWLPLVELNGGKNGTKWRGRRKERRERGLSSRFLLPHNLLCNSFFSVV